MFLPHHPHLSNCPQPVVFLDWPRQPSKSLSFVCVCLRLCVPAPLCAVSPPRLPFAFLCVFLQRGPQNDRPFVPLPRFTCSPEVLADAAAQAPFPLDGVIFYLNEVRALAGSWSVLFAPASHCFSCSFCCSFVPPQRFMCFSLSLIWLCKGGL